jgi:hypothetical protein
MAIQPIDLQTLFTQMDKVGKEQTVQKEGVVLHQAILGEQILKRSLEKQETVIATQDDDSVLENINDETGRRDTGRRDTGKRGGKQPPAYSLPIVKDPLVGGNIDLSG